jgi:predicted GTPase
MAKKNGFIIFGKTGSGKTILLNAIFWKEMGKVERSAKKVTIKSKVYYYKL